MTLIIRKYDSNNQDELTNLMKAWESANKVAHTFLKKDFVDKVRHDIPNVYIPNSETWVVDKDNQVIGFAALIHSEGAAVEVGAMFVHTDFHGIGAGKALMDKVVGLYTGLELEVFKENKIGRKFYDRYGFVVFKEFVYEPTGDIVLRMKYSKK